MSRGAAVATPINGPMSTISGFLLGNFQFSDDGSQMPAGKAFN
jgi:hypothetical protein